MREAVMGTFAEKNGRPAAAAAEGRPTCDAAYERIAREFLRQLAHDHDEDFAAAVAHRFKEAPAKVCCQAIGGWIEERLLGFGWTQHDLADRIGVDRSAVAKWTTGGAISLGHLVSVLLEFRGDFADLPLPARQELALEGYLAALSHVRARLDPAKGREPLDRERFWCLFHLFSEPFWERAIRRQDRELIREEADRVLRRAGESLGARPRRVVGVEGLRRLVEEWTATWVICLELLPGSWSIR
jgi:transcriptional regulator with XRE-family HTH domain